MRCHIGGMVVLYGSQGSGYGVSDFGFVAISVMMLEGGFRLWFLSLAKRLAGDATEGRHEIKEAIDTYKVPRIPESKRGMVLYKLCPEGGVLQSTSGCTATHTDPPACLLRCGCASLVRGTMGHTS